MRALNDEADENVHALTKEVNMYQVWTIHSDVKALGFYVVNTKTKKIQSSWPTKKEALQVMEDLNKYAHVVVELKKAA